MNNPILFVKNAGYGTTPEYQTSKFKRGDVVEISRSKYRPNFPAEAVVIAIVPLGFPPEYALADMLGEPRPIMITAPKRAVQYILANEGDPKPYLLSEKHLRPSGKPSVEIGSVARGGA